MPSITEAGKFISETREEVVLAVKHAIHSLADPGDSFKIVDKLTPSLITESLYTCRFGLPEVDAILRTSGEIRLSGFHLWESCNAELVFLECKWPELTEAIFLNALLELASRNRRNGI